LLGGFRHVPFASTWYSLNLLVPLVSNQQPKPYEDLGAQTMQPSDRSDASVSPVTQSANPGYALGQLAKTLATSETHENPDVRERAARKVEAWTRTIEGMLSGSLQVGSRGPVAGVPAWATLEVVKGGFATGLLLAEGELQTHEKELLARFPTIPTGAERAALNAHYLGDEGLDELQRLLANGCYRINVPEEGALLVVAWLVRNGQVDKARSLLDEISPYFPRLRFYPVADSRPLTAGPMVSLQTVGETITALQEIRPSPRVARQKEAISVWAPLYDRVISLFVETVTGPLPSLRLGPDGKPLRSESGKFHIEGGWPCQAYPEGWKARAQSLQDDYRRLRAEHQLCASPESATGGFSTLRDYLEGCIRVPEKLTGRDVGMIRAILAGLASGRGLPGSPRRQAMHERQARQLASPTTSDLARLLIERLSSLPVDQGLSSLDEVLAPVRSEEALRTGLPSGSPLRDSLVTRVRRCLEAPVGMLVEQGIIPSGEVLARVIPQVTAQVRAAGISDPELRRLYQAIYAAFRRRRSLLLLNLQSQVKLEELPWVQAINAHRQENLTSREQARLLLEELVVMALTAFPQQILPNKLLQEIRALADGAGLHLPIVDELAADIFTGTFTENFLRAAQSAVALLEGTLYERYYDIPCARVRVMGTTTSWWFGKPTTREFARLCVERAGESRSVSGRNVARNGKIIEQEQILTTHNLAVLFEALGLTEKLRPHLEEMALRCFGWVRHRLRQKNGPWKARLRAVKNSAYAWRQMIFFLSVALEGIVESFLTRAEGRLSEQQPDFQIRFRPALEGLVRAARGLPVEEVAGPNLPLGARRFLGWTTETHWLLEER
jgi:hypothetical protein